MAISRRDFLKFLGTAGVAASSASWLYTSLQAYMSDRLAFSELRGPGSVSFSNSVCRHCSNHCGLSMRKVDEIPVGLRGMSWHPQSQGGLCVAGQSQMQGFFDPDRLRRPIVRADAGASGESIEWNEALGTLRERIEKLIVDGLGDQFAVVDGRSPSLGTMLLESWVESIPGARYVPLRVERVLDRIAAGFLGQELEGRLRFDLKRTGTLLLVGSEILEIDGSPVSQMRAHADRRADPLLDHAPTIYLGPRRSPTGVQADYWIPCPPGGEREVLFALAQAISQGHPLRDETAAQYAIWVPEAGDWESFERRFSLGAVADRFGLKVDDLETVVRAMNEYGPAVTLPGAGILRRQYGAADTRAALALNLWTDGFRERGGLSWGQDPLQLVGRRLGIEVSHASTAAGLPEILDPLLSIKRSPMEVLLCVESDLVHEFPGRDQMARALSHIPFVASFSPYEDEISKVSHLTVPTLFSMETWDLPAVAWGYPEAALQVQRPAIVPVIEAPAVEDIILEWASDGVAGDNFNVPAQNAEELVEAGVSALIEMDDWTLVEADRQRPKAQVNDASARASLMFGEAVLVASAGKVSASSRPRPSAAISPPPPVDLAPQQLWLVPFDAAAIHTGRMLNRPMMMELSGLIHGLSWQSWVEIHPVDASRRKISTGDHVRIRGPRADIVTQAVVTRTIRRGTVAAPVGFGHEAMGAVAMGKGVNVLKLPYTTMDVETGLPAWGPIPVFLEKA